MNGKCHLFFFALSLLLLSGSTLSATASASFQIVSFGLDKEAIFVESSSSTDVEATVLVRNIEAVPANARVVISIRDPSGTEIASREFTGAFSQTPTSVSFVPNNIFTFLGSMEQGNYTFYASVYDAYDNSLDNQSIKVLTLALKKASSSSIPEFPELLPGLVAFSAIAILFFSGRQKIEPCS